MKESFNQSRNKSFFYQRKLINQHFFYAHTSAARKALSFSAPSTTTLNAKTIQDKDKMTS
jgi:hypothetical protein